MCVPLPEQMVIGSRCISALAVDEGCDEVARSGSGSGPCAEIVEAMLCA